MPTARFAYHVSLDLQDAPVLLVGGGRVAARKARGLIAAGARVTVVAPDVCDELATQDLAEVHRRPFDPGDVDGARLVMTATDVPAVERAVAAAARAANVWVNAADRPDECDFILPAIARRGRVSAAVSTDGASPALAIRLRDRIADMLDERVAAAADELARRRAAVKDGGGSTEDVDWGPQLDELLGEGRSA